MTSPADRLAIVIVVLGAINYLGIAVSGTDVIAEISSAPYIGTTLSRLMYSLIGFSGIWILYRTMTERED